MLCSIALRDIPAAKGASARYPAGNRGGIRYRFTLKMPISNYLVLHKASLFLHIIDLYLYFPPDDACSLNNREHRSGSFVGIFYRSGRCQAQAGQRHQQCENPPQDRLRQVMRKAGVEQRRARNRPAVQPAFERIQRWKARRYSSEKEEVRRKK